MFFFANGNKPEIYCGSADMMPRNLDRRVETVFPVEDQKLARHLREEVLESYLHERGNAWLMRPDGTYTLIRHASPVAPVVVT
jgi:polyphosphate kinase